MSGLSLYAMSEDYQRLLDLSEHAGTAEEEAMYVEAMRALTGTIEEKADRCAAVMATMQATADALHNEEQRLEARRKAIEANRSRLSEYVRQCLEDAQIEKVKGPRFTIMVATNPPRVVVDDEKLIDIRYWKSTPSLDKSSISADLKAGKSVPGAHLESSKGLRVR